MDTLTTETLRDAGAASASEAFLSAELRFCDVGTAEIAYRRFGQGPPLLLVHGWPLSGFTYRQILPALASRFTCYAVDLPGAGDTRWRADSDFGFRGQAQTLRRFVDGIGLRDFHVVAHDTGATITRALALIAGPRIGKLVLMGTEIPGHRPPWIPLFQRLAALPGALAAFRLLLSSSAFVRSPMGFGNCFVDRSLLAGDFTEHFIRPLRESRLRMDGQMRYLKGIDWALVDRLATDHRRINNPVLLVWGEQDTIFPVERARAMATQFADCRGFEVVPRAKLFVHEEQPAAVAAHIVRFLFAS
jgi:pimeloyl-ACP methyl ester carboxylesterase